MKQLALRAREGWGRNHETGPIRIIRQAAGVAETRANRKKTPELAKLRGGHQPAPDHCCLHSISPFDSDEPKPDSVMASGSPMDRMYLNVA
jgi:hypothetical protein